MIFQYIRLGRKCAPGGLFTIRDTHTPFLAIVWKWTRAWCDTYSRCVLLQTQRKCGRTLFAITSPNDLTTRTLFAIRQWIYPVTKELASYMSDPTWTRNKMTCSKFKKKRSSCQENKGHQYDQEKRDSQIQHSTYSDVKTWLRCGPPGVNNRTTLSTDKYTTCCHQRDVKYFLTNTEHWFQLGGVQMLGAVPVFKRTALQGRKQECVCVGVCDYG